MTDSWAWGSIRIVNYGGTPCIHLAGLLREPDSLDAEVVLSSPPGEQGQSGLLENAVWLVTVTRAGDDLWLSGEIHNQAEVECRRCLKPTTVTVDTSFQWLLRYQPGVEDGLVSLEDGSEEEIFVFGSPDLDLTPLLTEAFLLELPYTALCRDDCRGLCPVCGVDKNEVDCGHDLLSEGSSLANLEGLLDEV